MCTEFFPGVVENALFASERRDLEMHLRFRLLTLDHRSLDQLLTGGEIS